MLFFPNINTLNAGMHAKPSIRAMLLLYKSKKIKFGNPCK